MRNADRLLGVIYREVSLEKLFKDFENYQCNTRDFGMNINSPAFLRSAVVRYTHKYPNNYSLEEVENILKVYAGYGNVYIKANGNAIGLVFYCAEQLFSCIDGAILVKFDELLEWDGICNKIDANILIAAYASKHSNADLKKTGAVLKHDNFSLQKILHNGAADNHMHLKASGYCADMSWACLMLCSFNEDYILKTFIKESKMIERNFAISVSSALLLIKKIKFIRLYLKSWLLKYSDLKNLKRKFIVDLLNEKDDISFCVKISRLPIQYVINCIEHEYSSSNNIDKYFLVERNFQKQIFKLVSVINDVFLIHLFNIYLAAISQIRFFLVQDNEGMGFKKFKLNENVKDRLISLNSYSLKGIINEKEAYATVFDRCYKSQICKCAEFRIAPKSSIEDFNLTFKLIEDYSIIMWKKYYDVSKLNYGYIIHFIKNEEEKELKIGSFRGEKLREQYKKQTQILLSYIDKNFQYSDKIVGIDAANYEIDCRPELLAPFFRRFRENAISKKVLGITYHVGEAFDELCSGLRAIDEAIEFMGLHRGDRLGHALALGIDVKVFREVKRNMVALPLQNHVDNLAWMYYYISVRGNDYDKCSLSYLLYEFNQYSNELFLNTGLKIFSINDYVDSWILRGDSPDSYLDLKFLKRHIEDYNFNEFDNNYLVNKANLMHKKAFMNANARKLYIAYLQDVVLYKNGKKNIHVHLPDDYWKALETVQKLLRHKIYCLEISIETNPSSNRKISHVKKFIDLPLLEFNHHHLSNFKKDNGGEDLPVSINTDDCDIFQSDLANEYALIAAALQREKYSNQEIYDYIDYLRKASLLQTFLKNKI